MKKAISLLLALVLCLSLCACGGKSDAAYVSGLENRVAELENLLTSLDEENRRIIADFEQVIAEYEQTIADYEKRLNADNVGDEVENTEPENAELQYETVEITLDNWQEYFELRQFFIISLNGFGEVEEVDHYAYLVNKEGIIPHESNSNVVIEVEYTEEDRYCSIDLENNTFTLGETIASATNSKVANFYNKSVFIPAGHIIESEPGSIAYIRDESDLGEHCTMYGHQFYQVYNSGSASHTGYLVDFEVLQIQGNFCFARQDG